MVLPEGGAALTGSGLADLARLGRGLPGSVRVLVLHAPGSALAGPQPEEGDPRSWQQAVGWLCRPDLVSILALGGAASGAGCQLALACDLRIAATDASLCLPEASLGEVPALGVTGRLVAQVGLAVALELCLTGRQLSAAEAGRLGLVTAVVPPGDLASAAADLAAAVLAAPRHAVAEVKALLGGAARRSEAEQCEAERDALERCRRDRAGAGETGWI